ncbi:hypothetical protein [Lachnoclostridium phytofermentans]|uniref:S1/P1 Nuclease n=1 Tax=Lachnoclostridium phytofermentans (strain ATCC 700394 / DSM 18823 / ISDg) TaxID=357809 RepID=A9KKB9_LACP7|nr:hypothetical protein [Lachnoclostridium phytofermentans]ABX44110.1 hypothetical protein Cphy_3763 [Lachnoclostridium phytofermentans ISDg]
MKKGFTKLIARVLCLAMLVTCCMPSVKAEAWAGSDHKTSTKSVIADWGKGLSSDDRTLLEIASAWSDTAYPATSTNNKPLHGYMNYLAVLEYLYTIAVKVKSTTVENAIANTFFVDKGGVMTDGQITAIDDAIKAITKDPINGGKNENKAIKILGLAFHCAGDVYAHRTIVPADAVNTFNLEKTQFVFGSDPKTGWTSYENFTNGVSNGKVEFYEITKYRSGSSNYEDNIDFYSMRFKGATYGTCSFLMDGFMNNSSFSSSWIYSQSSGFVYKLHNMAYYLTGKGQEVKVYK